MGQKNSKQKAGAKSGMMVQKMDNTKLTVTKGGPDSSTISHSYLTVKLAGDDDISVGGMDEMGFVVPRHSDNICGVFLETLVITAPIDDPMPRDLAIFNLFNYDSPEDKMLAYIARPEVPKRDAKESFSAMLDVLLKVQASPEENYNFPTPLVAGRIKRLFFGCETFQQAEHDPEWRGRLVMLVSIPSNGVFISALLALSPTGLISNWLALVVGLGLVNALGVLHNNGFIHRYVTPWNFMLPTPFSINDIIYGTMIIDFSLATNWVERKKKEFGAVPFVGSQKYSSKRAITRHNQGPADDLVSVIFIVAELISGKLPWRAVKDVSQCIELKQNFNSSPQFKRLPHELRVVYNKLYRTYGLKRADHGAVVSAFKAALVRIRPEWKTEELPAFLSMPLEDS